MIRFISNLRPDLRSGGFSAMNVAAVNALRQRYPVTYVGPIDPPVSRLAKGTSKVLRLLGGTGAFASFSDARLRGIARDVVAACRNRALLNFFHGFTPWIHVRPAEPYVAWSDCTFRDYIAIYHPGVRFSTADISRVERLEAEWLRRARRIAFTSGWAAERAVAEYGLRRESIDVVGVPAEVDEPEADTYAGSKQFAFISTNFEAKGGPQVLRAFERVHAKNPDATLVVVGDMPPAVRQPGVTFVGFLRKEDPEQKRQLFTILATSRAIVHPTRSDIAPLLLVEAGCFGCPVIATRAFAIPEIVQHEVTGLLVDDPTDVGLLASSMTRMLAMPPDEYRRLRANAWNDTRRNKSRAAFDERLLSVVARVLDDERAATGPSSAVA